jgi:hypothetical protein
LPLFIQGVYIMANPIGTFTSQSQKQEGVTGMMSGRAGENVNSAQQDAIQTGKQMSNGKFAQSMSETENKAQGQAGDSIKASI